MQFGSMLFPYNDVPERDVTIVAETLGDAQLSEELGLDAVWLAEHHFSGVCCYCDPISMAAAIAATTKTLGIGIAVLQASFHHPVKLAEQIAFLDNLSRGRMMVGISRGNMGALYEYVAYGVKEADATERLEEVEEALIALWTGRNVTHHGKYYDMTIPAIRPAPFTRPHPPLYRAAFRDSTVVSLAKQGRPILVTWRSDDEIKAKLDLYRASMREAGRGEAELADALARSWTWRRIFVAETDQEAERIGPAALKAMRDDRYAESVKLHAEAGLTAPKPPTSEEALVWGSPARVAEQLQRMVGTGIGGAILQFRLGKMPTELVRNSMRLFASEVAPLFRKAKAPAAAG